jgi:hypothetical protein
MNEIDPTIGYDTLEPQQRVGGQEARQRGCNRALKSERTTHSNKPARLRLHPKRDLLDGVGFDDCRMRMFEDLLANIGQTEPPCRSIQEPHSESLLE